jgi:hypothetical protein
MPQNTRTLPLAASVAAGTVQRVVNYSGDTTLNVVTTGGESVAIPGNTSYSIGPLRGVDFQSNGVDAWIMSSDLRTPLTDVYVLSAPMTSIGTTATRIALQRDSGSSIWSVSTFFTVDVNGDLVAIRPIAVRYHASFAWTPNTTSNDDAGIILSSGVVSGTGTVVEDVYGNLFQSSRANSSSMGGSHEFGYSSLAEGDVLGFTAASYTGQSGTTDLSSFRLYVREFS